MLWGHLLDAYFICKTYETLSEQTDSKLSENAFPLSVHSALWAKVLIHTDLHDENDEQGNYVDAFKNTVKRTALTAP